MVVAYIPVYLLWEVSVERTSTIMVAFACVLASPAAWAQAPIDNIGAGGQLVVGVERVAGAVFQSESTHTPGNGTDIPSHGSTDKYTTIGLLAVNAPTPSSTPRVAVDYFVTNGLSLGAGLMYWSNAPSHEINGQTTSDPTTHEFLIQPRIGYALVLDDTFAIWPRAGFQYAHASVGSYSASRGDVTVDAMLGISPIKHVVFLVGPMLDVGVTGSQDYRVGTGGGAGAVTSTGSSDVKLTSFGLTAGLAAYFP